MSAVVLSTTDREEARRAAWMIGAAFRRARRAADDGQKQVAARFGIRTDNVARFELGYQENVKLGTVVRFLRLYGLTLAVVPIDPSDSTHTDAARGAA